MEADDVESRDKKDNKTDGLRVGSFFLSFLSHVLREWKSKFRQSLNQLGMRSSEIQRDPVSSGDRRPPA